MLRDGVPAGTRVRGLPTLHFWPHTRTALPGQPTQCRVGAWEGATSGHTSRTDTAPVTPSGALTGRRIFICFISRAPSRRRHTQPAPAADSSPCPALPACPNAAANGRPDQGRPTRDPSGKSPPQHPCWRPHLRRVELEGHAFRVTIGGSVKTRTRIQRDEGPSSTLCSGRAQLTKSRRPFSLSPTTTPVKDLNPPATADGTAAFLVRHSPCGCGAGRGETAQSASPETHEIERMLCISPLAPSISALSLAQRRRHPGDCVPWTTEPVAGEPRQPSIRLFNIRGIDRPAAFSPSRVYLSKTDVIELVIAS